MGAVRLVFRAELRRRWRSWLAIALLVALVGGFVLAATAAGRRTDSAFPRFVATYGFDAVAYTTQPVPKLATLPEVASATEVLSPATRSTSVLLRSTDQRQGFLRAAPTDWEAVFQAPFRTVARLVVSGPGPGVVYRATGLRRPNRNRDPGPLLCGVAAPSVFQCHRRTPPTPSGPTVAFHVVGIEVSEGEFPAGQTPSYTLYPGEGFARTVATPNGELPRLSPAPPSRHGRPSPVRRRRQRIERCQCGRVPRC